MFFTSGKDTLLISVILFLRSPDVHIIKTPAREQLSHDHVKRNIASFRDFIALAWTKISSQLAFEFLVKRAHIQLWLKTLHVITPLVRFKDVSELSVTSASDNHHFVMSTLHYPCPCMGSLGGVRVPHCWWARPAIRTSTESTLSFLFQNEQQKDDLERVAAHLHSAQIYVAALRDIIGQFRTIVEDLVSQEDNLQIVSCILFLILFVGYYCNSSAGQQGFQNKPAAAGAPAGVTRFTAGYVCFGTLIIFKQVKNVNSTKLLCFSLFLHSNQCYSPSTMFLRPGLTR